MSLFRYADDLIVRDEVLAVMVRADEGEKFVGEETWRSVLAAGIQFFGMCGTNVPSGRFWGPCLRITLEHCSVLVQREGEDVIALVFARSHRFSSDVSRRIHSHARH